jgi:hypothetical protein
MLHKIVGHIIISFILLILFSLSTIIHELGHAIAIKRIHKNEKIVIALGYQDQIVSTKKPFLVFNNIYFYNHKFFKKVLKFEKLTGITIPENEFSQEKYKVEEIRRIAKAGIKLEFLYLLLSSVLFVTDFLDLMALLTNMNDLNFYLKLILVSLIIIFVYLFVLSSYKKSSDYMISSSDINAIKFCENYYNKDSVYRYKNYLK